MFDTGQKSVGIVQEKIISIEKVLSFFRDSKETHLIAVQKAPPSLRFKPKLSKKVAFFINLKFSVIISYFNGISFLKMLDDISLALTFALPNQYSRG